MSEQTELKELQFDQDYTMEEAMAEANRCLNCPKPLCRTGCPIANEIPRFIQAIAQGNFGQANDILAERTNLPAICGRVCAREKQCEGHCIMNKAKKPPINIGKLERFAADFESTHIKRKTRPIIQNNGKVAVIGSGPAGLSVAGDLAKLGCKVTVYEGQPEPGGILLFGIPEFRLSKTIVRREIKRLENLGVEFVCNTFIGPDKTIDALLNEDGFDAVFIGTGTHVPATVKLKNEELPGVLQAMFLLTTEQLRLNGQLDDFEVPVQPGDRVVIIGAGNVAIDAARTSIRCGAKSVTIAYRRTQAQMPANPSEYEEAVEEGIQFKWLASPVGVEGDGKVESFQYEVQSIDEEGNVSGTGKIESMPADKVIIAVGHKPMSNLIGQGNHIKVDDRGYIITSEEEDCYGMTSREGVFAGGDVVHRPATVVLAMREAKKAVDGIVKYIEVKKAKEAAETAK